MRRLYHGIRANQSDFFPVYKQTFRVFANPEGQKSLEIDTDERI
jgi:hypothetical protein